MVRRNGTELILHMARVRSDTLFGTGVANAAVAIPLGEVQRIEVREGDTPKTIALVIGISIVAVGALYLAYLAALLGSGR